MVAALPIGLMLGTAPAGWAAPPGAAPSAHTREGAVTVTLVTGDKVTLAPGDGGRAAVKPAKGREDVGFAVFRQRDALYVIPRDAQRLVQAGKLDRRLFDVAGLARAGYHDAARDSVPLIVKYGAARRAVQGAQVTRQLAAIDSVAMNVHKEQSSAAWSTLAVAEKVWLDGMRRISLDQSVPQIGAPAAWQSGYTGQGVTVAVLDTGVDGDHPDLAGKVAESRNFSEAEEDGDEVGHGTHVASIIAGSGAASGGKYRGVAPDARLISGKVCESSFCTESAILAGMQWAAAEAHATVVNLSLGGGDTPEIDPLEEAVNTLTAEHGTLFAIAAGNSGSGDGTIDSPGSAEAALTVGAVDKSEALADFSSRGPRIGDEGMKPDITAPGVDIVAAKGSGTSIGEPVGEAYTTLSGTSMATPHVAGAAAILAQARPGWQAPQLKAALTGSARPNPALTGFQQGAGRVDVARAITQTVTTDPAGTSFGRPIWPHDDDEPVTRTVTYRNAGTSDVTLDLATRIVGPEGAAAPAGMFTLSAPRVTVPAGGTAQVNVTADTRVAGPDGLYSGHLTATGGDTVVSSPLGINKEVESYNLTVAHIDQTGAATDLYFTLLVAVDSSYWAFPYDEDGTFTARLPKGRYSLFTFIDRERAEDEWDTSFQTRPTVNLTEDASLTVDARQGKPVLTTIPERSAAPVLIDITATHVTELGGFSVGLWAADFEGLTTAHHGPALPANEYSSYVASQWAKPGPEGDFGDSPYFYAVSEGIPGRLPTGYTRHYRAGEFATVRQQFAAGPAGLIAERSVYPILDSSVGASAAILPVDLPGSRVEYVNTQGVRWSGDLWLGVLGEEGYLEPRVMYGQDLRSYRAGQVYRDEWNTGPFGPSFWSGGSIARLGDEVFVDVPLYGDRANHPGLSVTDTSRTALYRNGELVGETDCSACGLFEVPAGQANYRLVVADTRSLGDLTTRVSAAWTFRSGNVAGEVPAYLPASVVRFTPKLDAANAAPAGANFDIPVSVQRQPGAPSGGVKRLSVEVSYDDGKTWRTASLRKVRGEWIASVRHPQGAGFVSLRATAADTGGNTVTQTIIAAYRLK